MNRWKIDWSDFNEIATLADFKSEWRKLNASIYPGTTLNVNQNTRPASSNYLMQYLNDFLFKCLNDNKALNCNQTHTHWVHIWMYGLLYINRFFPLISTERTDLRFRWYLQIINRNIVENQCATHLSCRALVCLCHGKIIGSSNFINSIIHFVFPFSRSTPCTFLLGFYLVSVYWVLIGYRFIVNCARANCVCVCDISAKIPIFVFFLIQIENRFESMLSDCLCTNLVSVMAHPKLNP